MKRNETVQNRDIPDLKKPKLDEHEQKQQEVLEYISKYPTPIAESNDHHRLVRAPNNVLRDVIGVWRRR